MASPRLAKSLVALRDQVNAKYPSRSKSADGWIGDAAHRARKSDHNPNKAGVVQALDITNDLRHGCDVHAIAETLRLSKDPRLKYIISNRRIAEASNGWKWRKYTGSNPHEEHAHFSVSGIPARYDDPALWPIDGLPSTPDLTQPPVPPLLRLGSHGYDVETMQSLLNKHGAKPQLDVDADFGAKTETAVRAFQAKSKLVVDGRVGPGTWEKLRK